MKIHQAEEPNPALTPEDEEQAPKSTAHSETSTAFSSAKDWESQRGASQARMSKAAEPVASESRLRWIVETALSFGNFTSASLQLVFQVLGTIEVMCMAGLLKDSLEGSLRFPLRRDPGHRDIHSDIYARCRAERLGPGYDERFFEYIFDRYPEQQGKWQVFLPLIIVRDSRGTFHQDLVEWLRTLHQERSQEGLADRTVWSPIVPDGLHVEVVGTLVVSRTEPISDEEVRELLDEATHKYARAVFETTARSLAERCLVELVEGAQAVAGTIHLLTSKEVGSEGIQPGMLDQGHTSLYVGQGEKITTCRTARVGDIGGPPRVGGMGDRALRSGAPVLSGAEVLRETHPKHYAEGIRQLIALPLQFGTRRTGLVYLYYRSEVLGPADALRLQEWAQFVAMLIVFAKERVVSLNRIRRLNSLGTLESKLLGALHNDESLLRVIANEIVVTLGCDVVTLLPYVDGKYDESYSGGRMARKPVFDLSDGEVTLLRPRFCSKIADDEFVYRIRDEQFIADEGILATAMIPVRHAGRFFGLLVVDYRETHYYPAWEKLEIERLGALFAAIVRLTENGLSREALQEIKRAGTEAICNAQT